MMILGLFARWLFPPITLDMYSQRQQEDFYFWIYEETKAYEQTRNY